MGKNIVVCCDGTGNEFGDANSNVIKFYSVLTRDPHKQVTYYHPGVGTMGARNALTAIGKAWTRVRGLAFGYGVSDNIADAYQFLMETYQPGDRVYIFGFSRGAYTARALCGMLRMYGLLYAGNEGQIPYAIRLFKSGRKDKFELGARFKATFSQPCKPHFLGVWDTVSSVGWILDPAGMKPWRLPYTSKLDEVLVVRHAVSIDERRAFFRQNLVDEEPQPDHDVKQVWFPGVHCDVGGGYADKKSGLSKVALRWMLREAEAAKLIIDEGKRAAMLGSDGRHSKPEADALMHNSLTPRWWIGEFWLKRTMKRVSPAGQKPAVWKPRLRANLFRRRTIPEGAVIHESVIQRKQLVPDYKPRNLPKNYTVEPEPKESERASAAS